MQILEYELDLSTGERLSFCELDLELVPELGNDDLRLALSFILGLCTHIDKGVVEKAKRGDVKPFERLLRTPPYGCLLKLDRPVCSQIRSCASAKARECTTKNLVRKIGKFPFCWTYNLPEGTPESVSLSAQYIASHIVGAWKEGRYVIIVGEEQ